jgi:diguanylate cyclase (GGDEF)-like protein
MALGGLWLAIAGLVAGLVWALKRGDVLERAFHAQAQALASAQREAAGAQRQASQSEAERQFLARFIREFPLVTHELHTGARDREIPGLVLGLVTRLLEPQQAIVAVRRRGAESDPGREKRLTVTAVAPRHSYIAPRAEITLGWGELGFAAEAQRVMDRRDFDLAPPEQRSRMSADELPGFRPDLVAPLVVGERTVGLVAVAGPKSGSPEVKDVLRLIAQVAAVAMHEAARYSEMRLSASTDGLTGILNKGRVTQCLSESVEAARNEGGIFSIFLFDIDNFKHYNDRNGHPAGDRLLRALAGLVQSNIRRDALFGRFGGEEFLLVLPGAPKDKALAAAYNIRRLIAAHPFEFAAEQPLGCLSVSGGVATYPEDGCESATLLKAADEALYESKRSGRNRILPAVPLYLAGETQEPPAVEEPVLVCEEEWPDPALAAPSEPFGEPLLAFERDGDAEDGGVLVSPA